VQHVFQPECNVEETLQNADLGRPRLLNILLGLQTGFVSRVKFNCSMTVMI